jgi:hypothetical protein
MPPLEFLKVHVEFVCGEKNERPPQSGDQVRSKYFLKILVIVYSI